MRIQFRNKIAALTPKGIGPATRRCPAVAPQDGCYAEFVRIPARCGKIGHA